MHKFRILIVDDEKPARETLSYLIDWKDTAFEVAGTAKNGNDALEQYQRFKHELIITDIQMPVMDGLALIKAIRQDNKAQKFVILSCHEKFSYAKEAIQMGVTDYLIKDLLTCEDLFAVLDKVQRELEEESRRSLLLQTKVKPLAQNQRYSRHIRDAIEFISDNYRRDIELSEIAEALNLHRVYLSRLFKQETGENLFNYILKLRMEEAKRMMLSTNNKVYEIAEQVGYLSIQQFSAAFKKSTGLTPREFRNSYTGS
ncbi:MAG: response regulator [Dehalobacterium sp.]